MDYKMFFKKAFSDIRKDHSCPDDETVVNNILERAKTMNNNNENERTYNTQAYEVQPTPTKGHKALSVVAGIAGTAAVLAGAVFGLNWLNEHGGLKEGGIGSSNGAGYHEDMTEPAQSEAETTEAMTVSKAKTEVPATFELTTSAVTVTINRYEFDGKTLNLNWDVLFDNELEKYNDPEKSWHLLVNGMKNMDAFSFMGEPDENLKHIFTVTNSFSVPERIKNCSMTVELENPADSIDLIIPPTVHDDFDVPEYTFTATVNADNVQPTVNENTGKMIYDSGIEWEKYAVAIPDGTRYKFNGFVVEPRWCYFDGIKVRIAYDIIGENPDISKITVFGNEAEVTGYELYRSEDRILMMSDLTYPEARSTVNIDFIDMADGTKYTLPIKAPECVAVSAELEERSTQISVDISKVEVPGEYEFLYYIDDELQEELTETKDISETDKIVWDISGTGTHTYKIMIRRPDTQASGDFLECTVDFSKTEPTKDFGAFNSKIFKELTEIQQEDLSLIEGIYPPGYEPPYEVIEDDEESVNSTEDALPEFPKAISNGNGFYGEYLDTPITGDEAWELVKERGGIDYDYPFPYDKSIFKFTGTEFCIDYADFDVTALVGGTVEFAGFYQGWGNTVLILDDNGHYWLYGHLAKDLNVAQGNTVETGVKLGHTGSTGVTDHQRYAMRVG